MEYRNFKYDSADNDSATGEVSHKDYGWVPFTASQDDDTSELFNQLVDDGSIGAYVAPEPDAQDLLLGLQKKAEDSVRDECKARNFSSTTSMRTWALKEDGAALGGIAKKLSAWETVVVNKMIAIGEEVKQGKRNPFTISFDEEWIPFDESAY